MYHRRDIRQGNNQEHHNPGQDAVFERFVSMIHNMAPRPEDPSQRYAHGQENGPTDPGFTSAPRFQRTMYTTRTFRGGTASVTIFTGAPGPQQGQHQGSDAGGPNVSQPDDPFQTYV